MSMTKKDYELIAKEIDKFYNYIYKDSNIKREAFSRFAFSLAIELEQTYPRFDKFLFIEACGVTS